MLAATAGTGMVHDSEQPVADDTFVTAFKYLPTPPARDPQSGAFFGWDITRTNVKIEWITKRFQWVHTYRLRAFYGVKGIATSEKDFATIVDLVLSQFNQNVILGAAKLVLPEMSECTAYKTIFSVVCHYAEIMLDVPEIIDPVAQAGPPITSLDINYYMQPQHAAMTPPPDAEDVVSLGTDE